MSQKTISLLICALGGEGAGVLTEWIMEAAKDSDLKAQSTSIPGVAQRTGATTYYLEVFKTPIAQAKGLIPLFSLTPMPARLDGLLSSELLESARQCTLGFPSAKRTLSLSSSARTITTQERMELGDGRLDEERLRHIVTQSSRESYFIDMQALAKREGTIVSSVMLGVIAASELFPINKACYERVVSHSSSTGQASLRGFHAGFEALKRLQSQTQMVHELMAETTVTILTGPLTDQETSINTGGSIFEGPVPLTKAAVDLAVLRQQNRHVGQDQLTLVVMNLNHQQIKCLDVVQEALDLFVINVVVGKMVTTHFKQIIQGEILTRDNLYRVFKASVLLLNFPELALSPLFVPKPRCRDVDHAITVVDRHAKSTVGWHRIDNERFWCISKHFLRHINVGAQGVPTAGVIQNIVVIALNV